MHSDWVHFKTNLAPFWRFKKLPHRGQHAKNSLLKNNMFWASIFERFRRRFGRIFGLSFAGKTCEHCENMILAKTLKILLPSRRNANFQEIDVAKKRKNKHKSMKICMFFGTLILVGFGEGFGRALGGQNR